MVSDMTLCFWKKGEKGPKKGKKGAGGTIF